MTSKRTKKLRDAKSYAAAKYMRWAEDVLQTAAQDLNPLEPPVASTFHLGPFSGEPSDFSVWFIFATTEEGDSPAGTASVRRAQELTIAALAASGYPAEALETFRFYVTSREEIDKAGGEFAFFH